jgi:hypothetical protein
MRMHEPLSRHLPVVWTGVDPVTPRFSAGLNHRGTMQRLTKEGIQA